MVLYKLSLKYLPFGEVFGRTKRDIVCWYDAICCLMRNGQIPNFGTDFETIDHFAKVLGNKPVGFSDRRTLDSIEKVVTGELEFDFGGSQPADPQLIEVPVRRNFKVYFSEMQIDAFLDFQEHVPERITGALCGLVVNYSCAMSVCSYVPRDIFQAINKYRLSPETIARCQSVHDEIILGIAKNPNSKNHVPESTLRRSVEKHYGEGNVDFKEISPAKTEYKH